MQRSAARNMLKGMMGVIVLNIGHRAQERDGKVANV